MAEEVPIGMGKREYEVIPSGYYDAQVTGVYNIGRIWDNYWGKHKATIKIKFELNHLNKQGKPCLYFQDYSATMNAKGHLRKLVHAIEGKELTDQEATKYRISSMLGKNCMVCISVEPVKSDPTRTRNRLTAVVPPRMPVYVSQQPLEVWDYRTSDPDDAPNWVWDAHMTSIDYKPPVKPRVPKPITPMAQEAAKATAPANQYAAQPAAPAAPAASEQPSWMTT